MRKVSWPVVAVVCAAGALALAAPAPAAFPGANGRISFIRGANVFTMDPDGSHVRRLTSFPADTGVDIASWSPDSRHLVFGHFEPEVGTQAVWIMDADGSNLHKLLDDPAFFDQFPSFAPDGRAVAFMRCSFEGCPLYRVRTDGTGLRRLTALQPDIVDIAPTYSPDGRSLAFGNLNRGGVLSGIYIARPDGTGAHLITPPEISAFTPDWAPDSRTIAFQSNQLGSIFTVHPDGSGLTRLTNAARVHDQIPSWSPSGDAIAFERNTINFSSAAIWVMRPDGSHLRRLQANARSPRWSSAAG